MLQQNIVLTDLSVGMLQTAIEEAKRRAFAIRLSVCNMESLPFRSRQFDIVMAIHVIYHLADIPRGLKELARVMKPEGRLLATTNSDKIRVTIITLHYQALEILGIPFMPEGPSTFSLENGGELLAAHFRRVVRYSYEEEELFDNAARFRAVYETIGRYRNLLSRNDINDRAKQNLPHVVEQLLMFTKVA